MTSKPGADLVGRAFRGGDGFVRWVTHQSKRGMLHVLWLDERSGVWHIGGSHRPDAFPGGADVRAPGPGEAYKVAGPTGIIAECTVPA